MKVTDQSCMIHMGVFKLASSLDFKGLKQNIDLTQYAAYLGYKIDKKKSTRTSIAMHKDKSDKIIISKSNGTWIYFSVYDDSDNGTILDFIRNRTGRSIYQIGRELEAWLGKGLEISNQYEPYLKEKTFDPERIQRLFNYCKPAYNHAYLHGRGITNETLRSPRFVNRVFQDQFKNAVFPHFKKRKICGLELKGEHTDLFVRGSEKTLWRSNRMMEDDTLIISETPIDAISYHLMHQLKSGFYIATCGGFSAKQGIIIQNLVSDLPWIKNVVIATDNDEGGDKITKRLERLLYEAQYSKEIKRHSPDKRGCDWNDVLNQLGV